MIFPNPFRFAAALGRAFMSWLRGERVIVPEEIQIEREVQCHAPCPHWESDSDQCRLCTCFVALKIMFADEKCPAKPSRWGKWKKFTSRLYFSRSDRTTL